MITKRHKKCICKATAKQFSSMCIYSSDSQNELRKKILKCIEFKDEDYVNENWVRVALPSGSIWGVLRKYLFPVPKKKVKLKKK